ncbi:MAG: SDR family oxidoreductase [Spirochaetota bacterium]|nr:SDR family oxidoreductase [Spirochaetota bacterium]
MKGTALITGGAKRIGKEIVRFLASKGYKVAIHCNTSMDEAIKLKEEINKDNLICEIFKCDLSNENELFSLIPKVIDKFSDLNVLINNASVFQRINFLKTEIDIFNHIFNVNFKAPYFLSQNFAKVCKEGQIINIVDSKVAHNDIAYAIYTLSKKSLAELTKISAKELAPSIRVNAIGPGYILPPDKESKEYLIKRPDKIPLKRKGEIHEIIKSIDFLMENLFVTGQIIFTDGGEHL